MKVAVYNFGQHELAPLAAAFPQHMFTFAGSVTEAAQSVSEADAFIVSNRVCTRELGDAIRERGTPRLRLIHFTSAGIDNGLAMGLPPGVPVTNSSGIKAPAVSEHALCLLLALLHRLPQTSAAQSNRQWAREEVTPNLGTLPGRTACVIGLGPIGREVARKLKAFDARVVAVSRGGEDAAHVDALYTRGRLIEALAQSDIAILCTGADAENVGMMNADAFAALRPGALFVNVARGNLVEEPALMAALRRGHLAGAGLDVAEQEPLPPESPLWSIPNVIVTPHIAGAGSDGVPEQIVLFGRILTALEAGEPLPNRVRI